MSYRLKKSGVGGQYADNQHGDIWVQSIADIVDALEDNPWLADGTIFYSTGPIAWWTKTPKGVVDKTGTVVA